jgi:hypothetical protein
MSSPAAAATTITAPASGSQRSGRARSARATFRRTGSTSPAAAPTRVTARNAAAASATRPSSGASAAIIGPASTKPPISP